MKLGENTINTKFDEIENKVDFILELCREFQLENQALLLKIKGLEAELEAKANNEEKFSLQDEFVRSKIDRLLQKLDDFSDLEP